MKTLSYFAWFLGCLLFTSPLLGQTNDTPLPGTGTNGLPMKALIETAKVKATNIIEWAKKDFERIGAWKYKVVTFKAAGASDTDIEAKLNDLGKEGWECFWVRGRGDDMTFFLKKAEKSTITEAFKYRP
jgi:hypothetical protein